MVRTVTLDRYGMERVVIATFVAGHTTTILDRLHRKTRGWPRCWTMRCPVRKRPASFFNQFHDEEKIEQAQQELAAERVSYIPEESGPLQGLVRVKRS